MFYKRELLKKLRDGARVFMLHKGILSPDNENTFRVGFERALDNTPEGEIKTLYYCYSVAIIAEFMISDISLQIPLNFTIGLKNKKVYLN